MSRAESLIGGFNEAAKEPIGFPRYPYIDELPTFLSWPGVWLLARFTSAGPEVIALTGFLARLGIAALLVLGVAQHKTLLLVLLGYSILSDCADGQMARYSKRVSSLGGLYDLTSDLIGSAAVFAALSWSLSGPDPLAPGMYLLGSVALVCYFCSCTVWGFARFRQSTPQASLAQLTVQFCSPPANDHRTEGSYQLKFALLTALFRGSWGLISRGVLRLPIWGTRVRSPLLLHVHAIGSLNIHWTLLGVLLLLGKPLEYFFYYQLLLLPLLVMWVGITEVGTSDSHAA